MKEIFVLVKDNAGCNPTRCYKVPCGENVKPGRITGIPGNWQNVPRQNMEGGVPILPRTRITEIICDQ